MKHRVLWLVVLSLVCTAPALARVGSSYRTFRGSEFAKFFSLTVRSRKDLPAGATLIHLEPGGNQKHIDVEVTTNQSMHTVSAQLSVSREWIGAADSPNQFARDIVKSFVADLACDAADEGLQKVVDDVWHYQGDGAQVVKTAETSAAPATAAVAGSTPELEVFLGRQEHSNRSLKGCSLTFANEKVGESLWLRIRIEQSVVKP